MIAKKGSKMRREQIGSNNRKKEGRGRTRKQEKIEKIETH